MKLLNLNIGIKLDNHFDVVRLIEEENPDIVTIQEGMRKIDSSVIPQYDSVSFIQENTDYPYHFFGPLWFASHHEKNGVISKEFGGKTEQGNYVLSRYPFSLSENIFYYKNYHEFTDTTHFRTDDHPRAFTKNIIEVEGHQLLLINVHGIWTEDKLGDERVMVQIKRLIREVEKEGLPVIIVGDFNLLPTSSFISIMNEHFKNLISSFSVSSTRPFFDDGLDHGGIVCDYVFVSDKIEVTSFQVLPLTISDHYPLLLEFDIFDS